MIYPQTKIIICKDINDIATKSAGAFVGIANSAIKEKGLFLVALSGGSTPRTLYSLLAIDEYKNQIDWSRVHVFWGDERCVSPDHHDSNYRMANEALLSKTGIPESNTHRIKGELGADAAKDYEEVIIDFFRVTGSQPPRFDLVLLGMGDDGHTASIFPDTSAVTEANSTVAAVYVEKFAAERITLTHPTINAASNIFFLVSGKKKAGMLKTVIESDYTPERYPAQLIRNAEGNVTWFVDNTVASFLTK